MEGDFDIGIILYVVITLVAVLMGVLGKKKKPSGAGSKPAGQATGDDFLRNLEQAFNMGREEGKEVIVEPEKETVERESVTAMRERAARIKKERKEEAESRTSGLWEEHARLHGGDHMEGPMGAPGIEGDYRTKTTGGIESDTKFGTEGTPVFTEVQEPADQLQVIELGEFEGADYFDIVRDFDATTAVIYSAIINRTEY